MEHSNEPLTLVQLRKMLYENDFVGLNVLLSFRGSKCAGVIDERNDGDGICAVYAANCEWLKEKDYGKTWTAYAYQPARIDREEWKPCEECAPSCSWCKNYQESPKSISDICRSCKHYSHYEPEYKYCCECGRPLTDEAWDEMEKRIGG